MKKIRLFSLLILTAMFTLLFLVGCQQKDSVTSVYLKDHDPESVIEMEKGDFDYSPYTVVVTYASGTIEELALEEKMISAEDLLKFHQVGEHNITVSYGKCTYTFKVSVKRSSFGEIRFSENNVFTYDGKPHSVELEGDIPANAVITYPGGNSFVNAGTYDVTAVVACEGHTTVKLTTTIKIERAQYDMSGVKFEPKEFVYDGKTHSVAISGKLPEGVSAPVYTINDKVSSGASEVGVYTVRATFTSKNPNYEAIPYIETTLTITPAEYVIKGVDLVFKKSDGKVINGLAKVYDGLAITFDLNDYSKISKDISVSFSVYDESGNIISNSNKSTNIVNAGVYTVKAEFAIADSKNYKPIAPIVREFNVVKADYVIEGVDMYSDLLVYDGKEHSIEIDGNLPEGVTVHYEYYLGGVLVTDSDGNPAQNVTDAGYYTVKAVFSHNDANRKEIKGLSAKLNIEKIKVDSSTIIFMGERSFEYNGIPYKPELLTWQDVNALDYDIMSYSESKYYKLNSEGEYVEMAEGEFPESIGTYKVVATVTILDEYRSNYVFLSGNTSEDAIKIFEIKQKTIKVPKVTFSSNPIMGYTGTYQEIRYTLTHASASLSDLLIIEEAYYLRNASGEYVAMGENELPINAGMYKFVITVKTLNEYEDNYVLSNGETTAEFSMEFEIQKTVLEVPEISFTSLSKTMYSGNAQAVEFNVTSRLEFLTINVAYFQLNNEDKYIAMGENEVPTNSGWYRAIVTVSVSDAINYIYADGNTSVEASFDFIIEKQTFEVPEISFTSLSKTVFSAEEKAVVYSITPTSEFYAANLTYYKLNDSGVYVAMGENEVPLYAGFYKAVVTVSIKDTTNAVYANGKYSVEASFEFEIEKLIIDLSEIGFIGDGTEFAYDGWAHTLELKGGNSPFYYYLAPYNGKTVIYSLDNSLMMDDLPIFSGEYTAITNAYIKTEYEGSCEFSDGTTFKPLTARFKIV